MKIKFVFLALFISTFSFAQNYTLVWSDEFMDSEINSDVWTHEIGGHGWGNNELQYYTDRADNSYIEDGNLVIEAKQESYFGKSYTSARLISKDKKSFKYGRIEARMKLPYGKGIWPAFWMMGQNFSSAGWPACGEIDIMEMIGGGNDDRVTHGTVHWQHDGQHASYGGKHTNSSKLSDAYHIYAVEWDSQKIRWFFDGIAFHTVDITPGQLSEFHQNFFILLNLAVGGDWPGNPDGSTVFPQKFYIDYVRVYQDESVVPKVEISSPQTGATFSENENVNISAVTDFDGEIERVEFYQDAALIGIAKDEPYEWNINNPSPGNYKLSAIVYSDLGYSSESADVTITVGDGFTNSPYKMTPAIIPGKIEAENYDLGGTGVAFVDMNSTNNGLAYRPIGGVDIEACEDDGEGYNIGWTESGEWLLYSIEVLETADYTFNIRSASESATGKVSFQINGENVGSQVSLAPTGDWQVWNTTTSGAVQLTEGKHNLKLLIDEGNFNLNYFGIYKVGQSAEINLLSPFGGEELQIGEIYEIKWHNVMVDDIAIGYSANGGNTWKFIEASFPSEIGTYRWMVPNDKSDNCMIMIYEFGNASLNSSNSTPFTITDVVSVEESNVFVNKFDLNQNYPNPFNPTTKIEYSLPAAGNTQLLVYNSIGQIVKEILNGHHNAGTYSAEFDASGLSSGIYIFKLNQGIYSKTIKSILLK